MTQLMMQDAGFLKAQDLKRNASLAIGAVAVINGVSPDYNLLKTELAERIQAIPRCTQVLRTHVSDARTQEWIDYPGFDINHHIRRVALPQPGDDTELFGAIAHALECPLDLNRPLWECWVIEGLAKNRWAILMKIHHRMAAGLSAAYILTRLCDNAGSDMFAPNGGAKETKDTAEHGSQTDAWNWTGNLWRASTTVTATVFKAAARAVTGAATATGVLWTAVRAPQASPVATMRRYRTMPVPLTAVDGICRKFGVTPDDVALAAITEGFRTVLLRRGEQPRADSLRTLEKTDNHISAMLPYLPVEHSDLVQLLQTVHNRLNKTKQTSRRHTGSPRDLATNSMPYLLCAKAIQTLARLPQQGIVTLATNASGPRHRLRLMGQKMDRLLPIPPTALQLSTGVAVLSYADELVFGITADYDAEPDMEQLATGIELGMARLVALSEDSVLLFTRDRRKRSARKVPGGAQRGRMPALLVRARR